MGGNLFATAAADRAPEQGVLRGRGCARAAEPQRYPGLDLTAWQARTAPLPASGVGLLLAGQVIHRGLSRPGSLPGAGIWPLRRHARGGCTPTASRRRAGTVDSDLTPAAA
jgi:hypothetical protein